VSLIELKDSIIADIHANIETLQHNQKVFKAFQGNVLPIFNERIRKLESDIQQKDMETFQTLPNFFKKCVNKLSQIYNFDNIERVFNEDQDLFNFYIDILNPNLILHQANELANALNSVLLELFYNEDEGLLSARAIPNDRFWVYTNNALNPTKPTVYVKLVKDITLTAEQKKDYTNGVEYYIYTDSEFMIVNSYKEKKTKKLINNVEQIIENPLGFAPFIYISFDNYNLIPEIDSSVEGFIVQPGINYTEAHISQHYQGNPIRILTNVDAGNEKLSINPSDVLVINSPEGSGLEPKLQELPSTLDLSKAIELNKSLIEDFFYTKDCPIKKDANTDKSGLALMIESVDTYENRKKQINYFKVGEKEFWNKVAKYHNWIIKNKLAELDEETPKKSFNKSRYKVSVIFPTVSAEVEQKKEGEKIETVED
jgi:hypothetical protein